MLEQNSYNEEQKHLRLVPIETAIELVDDSEYLSIMILDIYLPKVSNFSSPQGGNSMMGTTRTKYQRTILVFGSKLFLLR